jgi:multidrug efflux pump subunit AcrA (membrane-fusion protein)
MLIGGGVMLILLVTGAVYLTAGAGDPEEKDLVWETVRYRPRLIKTLVERGALEAKNNKDVTCTVKARSQGSTVASTIKRLLAEDGDKVTKDQLLIELDSSGLEDQLKTQGITRDNAKLAWDQAEGNLIIVRSQNDSDNAKADTDLELAKIDLTKYKDAEYPALLDDVNNRLEQARDRVSYSDRMVKKDFMSASQAQADLFALRKVEHDAETLKLTYKRTVTALTRDLKEKENNKARVLEQTKTKEKTALTELATKKKIYEQEQKRYDEIVEEIKKCEIRAPQDGMVVYVVPEQARWGGGTQQSIVAQGEPVREGQKLMKIPDLSRMQVVVKVHEALVASVRIGQSANIEVEALPGKLFHGHVESVATVESKQDFMTADVKTYPTVISLQSDGTETLKPGMSAKVTVQLNRVDRPVLTVPEQAIIDPLKKGKNPTVIMKDADGDIVEREVVTGLSDDKVVEIRSGLEEGDKVVLNPSKWLKGRNLESGSTRGGHKDQDFRPEKKQPKDAKRGPNGKPNEPNGPAKAGNPAAGGFNMTPEQRQQMMEKWQKASPAQRKEMLQQVPPDFRETVKQRLKAQGLEIAD